jgi:hypothetical protein
VRSVCSITTSLCLYWCIVFLVSPPLILSLPLLVSRSASTARNDNLAERAYHNIDGRVTRAGTPPMHAELAHGSCREALLSLHAGAFRECLRVLACRGHAKGHCCCGPAVLPRSRGRGRARGPEGQTHESGLGGPGDHCEKASLRWLRSLRGEGLPRGRGLRSHGSVLGDRGGRRVRACRGDGGRRVRACWYGCWDAPAHGHGQVGRVRAHGQVGPCPRRGQEEGHGQHAQAGPQCCAQGGGTRPCPSQMSNENAQVCLWRASGWGDPSGWRAAAVGHGLGHRCALSLAEQCEPQCWPSSWP